MLISTIANGAMSSANKMNTDVCEKSDYIIILNWTQPIHQGSLQGILCVSKNLSSSSPCDYFGHRLNSIFQRCYRTCIFAVRSYSNSSIKNINSTFKLNPLKTRKQYITIRATGPHIVPQLTLTMNAWGAPPILQPSQIGTTFNPMNQEEHLNKKSFC